MSQSAPRAERTPALPPSSPVRRSRGSPRGWACRARRRARPSSRDAAKADVTGRGVDRLALPCSGAVAQAVVRRTEMRAALDHLAREALAGDVTLRRATR